MEDILVELIEMVKTLSPELWEIFLRQVYVEAITRTVGFVLLAVMGTILLLIGKKGTEQNDENKEFIGYMFGFASIAFSTALLFTCIGRIINPAYYAIQLLLMQF